MAVGTGKKLEKLKKAVKSAEKRGAEDKRYAEEQEKKEERIEREFWQGEGRKFDEKLRLAEEVFRWCREFCRTDEYRKLLARGISFAQDLEDSLQFYYGGWGHERGNGDCGRGSRLCLRKDETLFYCAGYKWMWPVYERHFKTAKELARELTKEYLKELHQFISTGEVYDELREEVKSAYKTSARKPPTSVAGMNRRKTYMLL